MELYCQYQFNDDNFVKDIDEGRGVTEDQTAAGAGVPKGINRLSCEYHLITNQILLQLNCQTQSLITYYLVGNFQNI